MSNSRKLKAQIKLFKELESQLLIQAERLGVKDDYGPLQLKEIEIEALNKHLIAFYQERANLEYEMMMGGGGGDKKTVLIKLERLLVYIKRAENMGRVDEKTLEKMLMKNNKNMILANQGQVGGMR